MGQSSVVRNIQLALFDEDFDLTETERAFIDELLLNGGNGAAAMAKVRPDLTPQSAKQIAHKKLRKVPANAEILRYQSWKRAQLVMRARLSEDELIEKARRVYMHGVGDMPLRRSVVAKLEDGGVEVSDVMVHEPSLPAANSAIETLRKLGGFGQDLRSGDGSEGRVALSPLERAAKVASLLALQARANGEPAAQDRSDDSVDAADE